MVRNPGFMARTFDFTSFETGFSFSEQAGFQSLVFCFRII